MTLFLFVEDMLLNSHEFTSHHLSLTDRVLGPPIVDTVPPAVDLDAAGIEALGQANIQ